VRFGADSGLLLTYIARVARPHTVTPEEARALVEQGYTYIDVRSEPEFAAGHPPGALNVPIAEGAPRAPNPDFLPVMEKAFPKDTKLVVGCQSGSRSRRAAEVLKAAGFTAVVEMPAGWVGARDEFGRLSPGWASLGMPAETGAPAGQAYADVKARSA